MRKTQKARFLHRMKSEPLSSSLSNLKYDLPAGLVVFLVALPLCLGIALASGAPLMSGIIAGVIGGLIVGPLSGSMLSVSGPAAGLTVIVLHSVEQLGSFEAFLAAVVVAGVFQLVLGLLRAGFVSYYFPSNVIKGMLAGIGVILILKQLPHALGYDESNMASVAFAERSENTFTQLYRAIRFLKPSALVLSFLAVFILLLWDRPALKKLPLLRFLPGPLVVVVLTTLLHEAWVQWWPAWALSANHLVNIPDLVGTQTNYQQQLPDWSHWKTPVFWGVAATIAVVASLETLLSLEAADKLDPWKRVSPPNRELLAQGVGNVVSGFLGGLPLTAVIVRSSANVTAGGRTRMAAIAHGLFMAAFVVLAPALLNRIPLAVLASILLVIGYKLSTIGLYRGMYRLGWSQFLPFAATVLAIVFTDLLTGIGIGLVIALYFILRNNYRNAFNWRKEMLPGETNRFAYHLALAQEVSYLNKGAIARFLRSIPHHSRVHIDGSQCVHIDYDVLEVIEAFRQNAPSRHIELQLSSIPQVELVNNH